MSSLGSSGSVGGRRLSEGRAEVDRAPARGDVPPRTLQVARRPAQDLGHLVRRELRPLGHHPGGGGRDHRRGEAGAVDEGVAVRDAVLRVPPHRGRGQHALARGREIDVHVLVREAGGLVDSVERGHREDVEVVPGLDRGLGGPAVAGGGHHQGAAAEGVAGGVVVGAAGARAGEAVAGGDDAGAVVDRLADRHRHVTTRERVAVDAHPGAGQHPLHADAVARRSDDARDRGAVGDGRREVLDLPLVRHVGPRRWALHGHPSPLHLGVLGVETLLDDGDRGDRALRRRQARRHHPGEPVLHARQGVRGRRAAGHERQPGDDRAREERHTSRPRAHPHPPAPVRSCRGRNYAATPGNWPPRGRVSTRMSPETRSAVRIISGFVRSSGPNSRLGFDESSMDAAVRPPGVAR